MFFCTAVVPPAMLSDSQPRMRSSHAPDGAKGAALLDQRVLAEQMGRELDHPLGQFGGNQLADRGLGAGLQAL